MWADKVTVALLVAAVFVDNVHAQGYLGGPVTYPASCVICCLGSDSCQSLADACSKDMAPLAGAHTARVTGGAFGGWHLLTPQEALTPGPSHRCFHRCAEAEEEEEKEGVEAGETGAAAEA